MNRKTPKWEADRARCLLAIEGIGADIQNAKTKAEFESRVEDLSHFLSCFYEKVEVDDPLTREILR